AAVPSLHAALTAMVAIFLWRRVAAGWRPVLVGYALIMAFSLVYTAEHYVVDILVGWGFAVAVLAVIARLETRWRRHPPSGHLTHEMGEEPGHNWPLDAEKCATA